MEKATEYLDPEHRLVDETVAWLCGDEHFASKVRETREGARSLSHMLVVVPTAQSGRSLRMKLAEAASAKGWGGILPPVVTTANALLSPENKLVADEAGELATMASVLMEADLGRFAALFPRPPSERSEAWALDMAAMVLGVDGVLGERALRIADVQPDLEEERWLDLAEIERLFTKALAEKGFVSRGQNRRQAVQAGCVEPGVEEIVLPAALDVNGAFVDYLGNSPQKVRVLVHAKEADAGRFDDWGRPREYFAAQIPPSMVASLPSPVREADAIAAFFRSIPANEALPALAVCDQEMYPELEGAFQNHFSGDELALMNPAKEKLANSALGRLLSEVMRISAHEDYDLLSTFLRSGDVCRWAAGELRVSVEDVARYVGALDAVQNAHLPRTIAETLAGIEAQETSARHESERLAAAGLKRLVVAVRKELADPFAFMRKIFAALTLDERRPSDRELIAAAESVRDLRAQCDGPLVPPAFKDALLVRLLDSAVYSLEPTAANALSTIGWLEMPWCAEEEMVISGFNDGAVPENIVGHPFIPDSLRGKLGLMTNERRAMRDSFIFAQAVGCRKRGAVSVYLHQIAGDGSVMKPSRILFDGIGDADLPALAKRLYAVTKGDEGTPSKELPPAWRLKLPFPPAAKTYRDRISPSKIDDYLRCPFNFYLQETFGEHSDDRNQELDAMAFGTICHEALDRFAKEGPKDSTDDREIAEFLAADVRRQLKVFGTNLPAIIELQGEAAIERLRNFASRQAERRSAGWRIIESEQNLECRIKNCPTLLRGKVDRIDRHEETGDLAIIDYKTWSRFEIDKAKNSVQLPIYRAMVEASNRYDPAKAHAAKAFYCVLAERAEDVRFCDEYVYHEGIQSECEDKVVKLLDNLAKGIFYPPSKDEWTKTYGTLIWESPENGIDPEWIADQNRRREVEK